MVNTVFFDFDGVLTLDKSGNDTIAHNLYTAFPHLDRDEICRVLREVIPTAVYTGQSRYSDHWADVAERLDIEVGRGTMNAVLTDVKENQDMFRLASELATDRRIGILTDNGKQRMDLISDDLELERRFDPIVVSAEVGATKFDGTGRIFDAALEQAGTSAENTVFIDNSPSNLALPKQMGMHTYHHDDQRNDMGALREWLAQTLDV